MPWCPKCRNEYREGIRVCADCGCELTETLTEEKPLTFGEEQQMQALREFLQFNRINDVELRYDEKEGVHELLVKETDYKKASSLADVFLQQEARKAMEKKQKEPEAEIPQPVPRPSYLYRGSAEQAEDNKSSAWALLVVGGVGLIVLALGMLGILPIHLYGTNKYMVYGVLLALVLLFLVMGCVSLKNSKLFAKKAESENSLRGTMEKWCLENLKQEEIDGTLGLEKVTEEEILYFKRAAEMKERLNRQFVNLDEAFLESFIDDVYDSVFQKG